MAGNLNVGFPFKHQLLTVRRLKLQDSFGNLVIVLESQNRDCISVGDVPELSVLPNERFYEQGVELFLLANQVVIRHIPNLDFGLVEIERHRQIKTVFAELESDGFVFVVLLQVSQKLKDFGIKEGEGAALSNGEHLRVGRKFGGNARLVRVDNLFQRLKLTYVPNQDILVIAASNHVSAVRRQVHVSHIFLMMAFFFHILELFIQPVQILILVTENNIVQSETNNFGVLHCQ